MQRDSRGRFVKGNKAAEGHDGSNAGRPPKQRETRYYEILVSTITYAQWERIIRKAGQQAERGDHQARKWLADYIVGTPEQNINVSGGYPVVVYNAPDEPLDDT